MIVEMESQAGTREEGVIGEVRLDGGECMRPIRNSKLK